MTVKEWLEKNLDQVEEQVEKITDRPKFRAITDREGFMMAVIGRGHDPLIARIAWEVLNGK